MDSQKLVFMDCTLRDGEQAPGVFFTLEEKLALTDLLDAAGIDIVDAGMPSVSKEERDTISALLDRGYRAVIAGTVRALPHDIDLAVSCGLKDIFLFMPVSPQHLQHKFGITLEEARPRIENAVDYAIEKGLRVNFVAEDTVRADPVQLAPLFDKVAELGAVSVIICDTVGVMRPGSISKYVATLRQEMKAEITLGVHCHNDYGLGTANTLAAVEAGCTLITATVNGLGERAGNAPLEEVICALDNLYDMKIDINKAVLPELCERVAAASGVFVMPTKPIVGLNVFRHESGVHVDGMLKDPSTYEAIDPYQLGKEHQYLLGKHSGRGLIELMLTRKGLAVGPDVVGRILEQVKLAKVSRDKAAFREMAERLEQFWSEHLSFSEEEFWELVQQEVRRDSQQTMVGQSTV